MTPETLFLIGDKLFDECRGASKVNAMPFITKALQSVADETTVELFEGEDSKVSRIEQAAYVKGRDEALEEAAKLFKPGYAYSDPGQMILELKTQPAGETK